MKPKYEYFLNVGAKSIPIPVTVWFDDYQKTYNIKAHGSPSPIVVSCKTETVLISVG